MERWSEIAADEALNGIGSMPFEEARSAVMEKLREGLTRLPIEVRELLPPISDQASVHLTASDIEQWDARYFELEELGELHKAANYFRAARVASAIVFAQGATEHDDLYGAIYELRHAF